MFAIIRPILNKEKLDKVTEFYMQLHNLQLNYFKFWKENTFLQWDFWVSVILTILPWVVWTKFHRRRSRHRLLFVGFFIILITSYMDFIGTQLGAWIYTGKAIPTLPTYTPWDFSLFPVSVMVLIEYKPHISPFLKGIIFAAIGTLGEILFMWLGFYRVIKWSVLYSIPIYILIYVFAHWLSRREYFDDI